jgi:hypothetical protein
MDPNSGARRAAFAIAAVYALHLAPRAAQVPADVAASDARLSCATRLASAEGFRPAPVGRAGRIAMMRSRTSPGGSYLDALAVTMPSQDSAGTRPLEVRVTTFLMSRVTGLNEREVTPPRAVLALADSIRLSCRRPSGRGVEGSGR